MAETLANGLEDLALTWTGRAVDIGRIEAELGKLRYMMTGGPPSVDGFAPRTSIMNMVTYSRREEDADMAAKVIEDLATHHPSRALIVLARPHGEESRIEAQLAAHSHISRTLEQSVCCEEIWLTVSGPAARHLHSIIVPLLEPDLPVYLWWTDRLTEDSHLMTQLMESADRVIVDSNRFQDQLADLLALARLHQAGPRTAIGDLNWRRLEHWREFIHRQSNITEMHHHLSSAKSVEIRFADSQPSRPAQAFLLLAWLAGKLGWDTSSLSARGPQSLTFRGEEGRQVSAFIQPVSYSAVDPGSVVSMKIACESETASALLTISLTGDPYHVTIRTEHRGGVEEEQVRLEPTGISMLMMSELNAPVDDSAYSDVLRTAIPIIMAAGA